MLKFPPRKIPKVSTDEDLYQEGQAICQDFLLVYPDSENKERIVQLSNKLKEEKAKKIYEIARFYEKQKEKKAALIYYQKLVNQLPETRYGQLAREKIAQYK